jgi:hypothetical protein
MKNLQITKELLDTPFSKFIDGATNPETPRQFIRSSEKEFEMKRADIENMDEEELNGYIEFLDYLWTK